jgi:enoyl-[acyl-carrier protein] reductase II
MLIDRFFKVGREFLGCKYPIMCGAMTWISDPNLVCAVGQISHHVRRHDMDQ